MKRWYAVYCKPQQDARAELHLRNQSYEVFRPLLRWKRRYSSSIKQITESMFPRYLFICLDDIADNWAPIRSTRGVVGLVSWGVHVPCVPNQVVDEIRSHMDADGCVDLGVKEYRQNDRVRITEGPFAGYEGLFSKCSGKQRVVVLLKIMQKTQYLEMPEQAIIGV